LPARPRLAATGANRHRNRCVQLSQFTFRQIAFDFPRLNLARLGIEVIPNQAHNLRTNLAGPCFVENQLRDLFLLRIRTDTGKNCRMPVHGRRVLIH
jgi:hypothetical protein